MALAQRFEWPDGAKLALKRRFGRPHGAQLALEQRFGRPDGVVDGLMALSWPRTASLKALVVPS